jgi:hypothetical protein
MTMIFLLLLLRLHPAACVEHMQQLAHYPLTLDGFVTPDGGGNAAIQVVGKHALSKGVEHALYILNARHQRHRITVVLVHLLKLAHTLLCAIQPGEPLRLALGGTGRGG